MNRQDEHKYDDIISLPHHVSKKHPQMSLLNRAAQFSPFAALTGYEAAIQETERRTDPFIELDEGRKAQINEQLLLILENLDSRPEVEVTYFVPDEKKSGGKYMSICGKVRNINKYNRQIAFTNG